MRSQSFKALFIGSWLALTAILVVAACWNPLSRAVVTAVGSRKPAAEIQAKGEPEIAATLPAPQPEQMVTMVPAIWWVGTLECAGISYTMTLEMNRENQPSQANLRVRKTSDPLGRRAFYPLGFYRDGSTPQLDFPREGGRREYPNGYEEVMTLRGTIVGEGDRMEGDAIVPSNEVCGKWSAEAATEDAALETVSLESTLPPDPDAPRSVRRFTSGAAPH